MNKQSMEIMIESIHDAIRILGWHLQFIVEDSTAKARRYRIVPPSTSVFYTYTATYNKLVCHVGGTRKQFNDASLTTLILEKGVHAFAKASKFTDKSDKVWIGDPVERTQFKRKPYFTIHLHVPIGLIQLALRHKEAGTEPIEEGLEETELKANNAPIFYNPAKESWPATGDTTKFRLPQAVLDGMEIQLSNIQSIKALISEMNTPRRCLLDSNLDGDCPLCHSLPGGCPNRQPKYSYEEWRDEFDAITKADGTFGNTIIRQMLAATKRAELTRPETALILLTQLSKLLTMMTRKKSTDEITPESGLRVIWESTIVTVIEKQRNRVTKAVHEALTNASVETQLQSNEAGGNDTTTDHTDDTKTDTQVDTKTDSQITGF